MVKISATNLQAAIKNIKAKQQQLQNIELYLSEFANKLAKIGLEYARMSYSKAQYDGTNDVTVTIEADKPNVVRVVASGKAVLFIEFGTGINYPDDHPKAGELNMIRGEYGKKQGQKESWVYVGEEGTNGTVIRRGANGNAVRTRGNPASRSMYQAAEEIRKQIQTIAEEVFA